MKITLRPLSQYILQALVWTTLSLPFANMAYAHSSLNADAINELKNAGLSSNPLSIPSLNVPTLVMLVIGRDHNLFTEAYSDYTDLTGDDTIDYMFDPSFNYYGLFDSNLCYQYKAKTNNNFFNENTENVSDKDNDLGFWVPVSLATGRVEHWTVGSIARGGTVKVCPGNDKWSGNFLNYVTTSRIDVIRKVLYGGTRTTNAMKPKDVTKDTKTAYYPYKADGEDYKAVLLKHSNVLRDAHGWGKVFAPRMYPGASFTYDDFIGESSNVSDTGAVFIGLASWDDADVENPWNKDRAAYMRVGWVPKNAGVPGEASKLNEDKKFIWDWVSIQGSENKKDIGSFYDKSSIFGGAQANSYDVLIVSCMKVDGYINLEECEDHTTSNTNPGWRPYGILQEYNGTANGKTPSMQFGLITGSWGRNVPTSASASVSASNGAALRANIGDYATEFDDTTGDFNYNTVTCAKGSVCGFVSTLDAFRIRGKVDGTTVNYDDCHSWDTYTKELLANGLSQGKCKDWGNPVSRLLLAAGKYFAGKLGDTATFEDNTALGTGTVNFKDPYPRSSDDSTGKQPYCSRPVSIVMADESISYDTSTYGTGIDDVDWSTVNSGFQKGKYFVGDSTSAVTEDNSTEDYYKFLPSLKTVNSLQNVIGLAPSVAFAYGGYTVAAVAAKYSHDNMITVADKKNQSVNHKMETYVVAMKPNMPEIKVNIGNGQTVSIIPFAVTPAYSVNKVPQKDVRSINQVADFYVESLSDTEGVFRINYEDFQFGSDYDMDWIVEYQYKVLTDKRGQKYIRIQISNVESDGYANQHAGYIITGVDYAGVYVDLEKPEITESPFEVSDDHPYKYHIKIDTPITDLTLINCYNHSSHSSLSATDILKCFKNDNIAKDCSSDCNGTKTVDFASKYQWVDNNVETQYQRIKATNGFYYKDKYSIAKNGELKCSNINAGSTNIDKDANGMTICNDLSLRNLGHRWRVEHLDGVTASSRLFKVNGNSENGWLKSPLWYAAKNGLRDTNSATAGEPANYFLATDPSKIKTGLKNILDQISKATHSGMNFSPESTTTSEGDVVYGTQYDPSNWWGDVLKGKIGSTGGYETTNEATGVTRIQTIAWSAAKQFEAMPIEKRLIFTVDHDDPSGKAPYKRIYSTKSDDSKFGALDYLGENVFKKMLPESARATFNSHDADDVNKDAYLFMNRFTRWLVGEHDFEGVKSATSADQDLALNGASPLRERTNFVAGGTQHFVLGDVIDAKAVAFSINNNKFVAVGSNDGMLHFLNAETGDPILSYMPTAFLEEIHELADPSYNRSFHRYRVNSDPVVTTFDTKTYVYGSFGLGYPGAYALDISGLGEFLDSELDGDTRFSYLGSNVKLLWEALDANHGGSDYVGKMRDAPVKIDITDEHGNKAPYLVFTSGYEAVKPGFFIVNLDPLATGACKSAADNKLACFASTVDLSSYDSPLTHSTITVTDPLGIDRKNGFAMPSVAVQDSFSNHYNAIYFGDLFGNVWKIDLDADTSNNIQHNVADWGQTLETKPNIIFTAKDSHGDVQSITGRIGVAYANAKFSLVFGTGQFLYVTDNKEISTHYNNYQSVYVLRDGMGLGVSKEGKICADSSSTMCIRKVGIVKDENFVNRRYGGVNAKDGDLGWYFDLTDENGTEYTGERVYTNPLILNTRAYITTNTPNVGDECLGAGTSSLVSIDLMQLQATTVANYSSLAGSPSATVHEGKVKIHVPVDAVSSANSAGGAPEEYNYEDPTLNIKYSSTVRIF